MSIEQAAYFKNTIAALLEEAKNKGSRQAEAYLHYQTGLSTTVRMGAVDTVEFNKDKVLNLTVYKGNRKGSVSTTDLSKEALTTAIDAALRIATYTEEDKFSGLADVDRLATSIPDLNLYYPADISPEQAIEWAKECEDAARAADPRITQSEGATFSTHAVVHAYGNSQGFIGAFPTTRHSLNCVVVGESKGLLQRDYDFSVARDIQDLTPATTIGRLAAERTVKRLDARKIKTGQVPVIFSKEIAGSLWGQLIAAISGGNLYRQSSFLLDHLGKTIFPDFVHIEEVPHLLKGLRSAPYDNEGVRTTRHDIIREGVLESYVLDSYSARKLGFETTGNAGGIHNLQISSGALDLEDLIKKMDKGLLITSLMGQGVNLVTGDYSRGAAGFWVEQGIIQYPVEEITVAGNLKDMFMHIVDIGCDIEKRSHILTGSVLIENMMIGGV
jgi:PmbA protein